jgi:hypothetical protein
VKEFATGEEMSRHAREAHSKALGNLKDERTNAAKSVRCCLCRFFLAKGKLITHARRHHPKATKGNDSAAKHDVMLDRLSGSFGGEKRR